MLIFVIFKEVVEAYYLGHDVVLPGLYYRICVWFIIKPQAYKVYRQLKKNEAFSLIKAFENLKDSHTFCLIICKLWFSIIMQPFMALALFVPKLWAKM